MWSPYGARDANFHCAFFVLKSVMLTSGVDLWTCRSLVLCYHVCGCLEHVKLVQRLMPTLLRLVFEERDANFRIVPYVCGCLERNSNRVVCVFNGTKKVVKNEN